MHGTIENNWSRFYCARTEEQATWQAYLRGCVTLEYFFTTQRNRMAEFEIARIRPQK